MNISIPANENSAKRIQDAAFELQGTNYQHVHLPPHEMGNVRAHYEQTKDLILHILRKAMEAGEETAAINLPGSPHTYRIVDQVVPAPKGTKDGDGHDVIFFEVSRVYMFDCKNDGLVDDGVTFDAMYLGIFYIPVVVWGDAGAGMDDMCLGAVDSENSCYAEVIPGVERVHIPC